MNQPSLVLPFTSLYGTSAHDINIQVGYCWSFVLVVNCVQFPQVWCIRSPASSQWDFWEAEVTAASRGPIVLLLELCYIGSIASFRISADSIFWRIFHLGVFVNLKVSTTADNSRNSSAIYSTRHHFWFGWKLIQWGTSSVDCFKQFDRQLRGWNSNRPPGWGRWQKSFSKLDSYDRRFIFEQQ